MLRTEPGPPKNKQDLYQSATSFITFLMAPAKVRLQSSWFIIMRLSTTAFKQNQLTVAKVSWAFKSRWMDADRIGRSRFRVAENSTGKCFCKSFSELQFWTIQTLFCLALHHRTVSYISQFMFHRLAMIGCNFSLAYIYACSLTDRYNRVPAAVDSAASPGC